MKFGRGDTQRLPRRTVPAAPVRGWSGIYRRRWGPVGRLIVTVVDLLVLFALALVIASLLLSGREVPAPEWVRDRVAARLDQTIGPGLADIDGISVLFDRIGPLEVRLKDVALNDPSGARIVLVPQVALELERSALWQGKLRPSGLVLDGAVFRLRRDRDGRIAFGFGDTVPALKVASPADAIAALQGLFARPGLAWIERIEARHVVLDYADERAARAWRIEDGALAFEQTGDALSVGLSFALPGQGEPDPADDGSPKAAHAALRLVANRTAPEAVLSVLVEDVPAHDIAAHSPALAWLEPLEAHVSGALIAKLDATGQIGPIDGTLEIGPGRVSPGVDAASIVRFDGAKTYFSYRPETERVRFDTLDLRAADLTMQASGHVLLNGLETGWPTTLVGQFQISKLDMNPREVFAGPLQFSGGALDLKVVLSPLSVRIGQLTLTLPSVADTLSGSDLDAASASPSTGQDEVVSLTVSGTVDAKPEGWIASFDASVPRLTPPDLLALWPVPAVPLTRIFLDKNFLGGTVEDAHAVVRLTQGEKPRIAVGFEFRDATLKVIQTLPAIESAVGFGSILDKAFSLSLEEGHLIAPGQGRVDLGGSTFALEDITQKPPDATLSLRIGTDVTPILEVLDLPPFRFLQKAKRPTDIVAGKAQALALLKFPMGKRITVDQVNFDVTAELTDVQSESLVPGRVLAAQTLQVAVNPSELSVLGKATLDGIPVEGRFAQPLGAPGLAARVDGGMRVGQTLVETFGIGLPKGMVRGEGWGRFTLILPPDDAPQISMTSDLAGISLSVPPLGWSLGAQSTGKLEIEARLGQQPRLDRLKLEGGELLAEGDVTIKPGGGLDQATFSRIRVGSWLDAAVTLSGRGANRTPAIAVRGGRADLRGAVASGGAGGGAATGSTPMSIVLDRLTVSDGIALTGLRGDFSTARGLSGRFTARVNGEAAVTGQVAPSGRGTAVRLDSSDAGAVLAAANLFERGRGGTLAMSLTPRSGAGDYDGALQVKDIRVQSAPGLAALLNAISVVGLLDQMNGSGILFNQVQARFRLTPRAIEVSSASGTGPSVGITVEGVYDMARDRLNMQGVFSPSYALNSIGQIFTRRGEGLVGLTYTMTGSAKAPKVVVNPLSALTPGMFREIFRAKPPTLGGE